MTYAAFGIHKELVETEGFDPNSDEYYTELDKRIAEEFPHKLKITITPLIFLIVMKELYDSINPLHWWPMFWGYRCPLPDDEHITIRPLDGEDIVKKYGGRMNVFIIDHEHVKFRKRKDAVMFGLTNFIF